ncbi:hypothetical protein, partial [Escherichia coli]|uniref:hypothetical protein n=1 Tax=Escherichia coli TaxID=562 RepID=UPI001BB004A6
MASPFNSYEPCVVDDSLAKNKLGKDCIVFYVLITVYLFTLPYYTITMPPRKEKKKKRKERQEKKKKKK